MPFSDEFLSDSGPSERNGNQPLGSERNPRTPEGPTEFQQQREGQTTPGIIQAQERLSRLEERAEVIENQANESETLDTHFDERNLETPEGVRDELFKYDITCGQLGVEGEAVSDDVNYFVSVFEDFNREQAGLRGLLHTISTRGNPAGARMRERLEKFQLRVAERTVELRSKRREIESYEQKLQEAMARMRERQTAQRDEKLAEIDAHGEGIDQRTEQQKQRYAFFTDAHERTVTLGQQLSDYGAGIDRQLTARSEQGEALRVNEGHLNEFGNLLQHSLSQIEESLRNNPPTPQRGALERARDELLEKQQATQAGLLEVTHGRGRVEGETHELEANRQHTDEQTLTLQGHLENVVTPTLHTIDDSIHALEVARLQNGSQREMMQGYYEQFFSYLSDVDTEVQLTVAQNKIHRAQMFQGLTAQKHALKRLSVASVSPSMVLEDFGTGTREMFGAVSSRLLDPASRWVKESTKNIPVVNVLAQVSANVILDLPSGIIEGTGELLGGIATLVAHPIQTLEGLSALIPVYNSTNGRFFDFSGAGQAWASMWRALIAYEDFEHGNIGKGVGKVALNVLTTVTGAGAAAKCGAAASVAFRIARASGRGALRSSLRATGTGGRFFVTEFASGLSRIPGNVLTTSGNMLRAPSRFVRSLRLGSEGKLAQEIASMTTAYDRLASRLEGMTIAGRSVAEIPGLKLLPARRLAELSGAELIQMGITDSVSIREFLEYRNLIGTFDELSHNLSTRVRQAAGMTDEMRAMAPGSQVMLEGGGAVYLKRALELEMGDEISLRTGGLLQVSDMSRHYDQILLVNLERPLDRTHWMILTREELLAKLSTGEFRDIRQIFPREPRQPSLEHFQYHVGGTVRIRRSSGAIQEAMISEMDSQTGALQVQWHETMPVSRIMLDELNPQYMNDFRSGDVVGVNIEGEVHSAKIVKFDDETGVAIIAYRKIKLCQKSEVDMLMRQIRITKHGPVRPVRRDGMPAPPSPEPGAEVYIERSNGVLERGWTVDAVNLDGTFNVSRQAGRQRLVHRNHPSEAVFALDEIENSSHPNLSLPNAAANFERMKFQILRQQATLSLENFSHLFRNWPLQQRNVGNCYLISALNSLRASPHFEMLMRASIKAFSERRGFRTVQRWEVRIPLGDRNGRVVTVIQEDLERTRNVQYRRPDPLRRGETDNRRYLEPVDASEGFKILEAAYIKYVNGGVMNRAAIEGGFGHEALLELLGDNFNKIKIDGTYGRRPVDWESRHGHDITHLEYSNASSFDMGGRSVRHELFEFLDEFHPGKHMATANTPSAPGGDLRRFRILGVDYEFVNNHAYSIVQTIRPSLSPDGIGRVTITNPWNTGEAIVLTYDQFSKTFSQISGVEMDYTRLTQQLQEHARAVAR